MKNSKVNSAFKFLTLILLIFSFLMVSGFNSFAEEKHHPINKYTVEYNAKGFYTGTKKFCSRNWGNEVVEFKLGKITTPDGKVIIENKKVITKIEGDSQWIISINLDTNTGKKLKNPMYAQISKLMEGKSPGEKKKFMLQSMGGKITGKKTILGLECNIWKLDVINTCITDDSLNLENSSPTNDIYEVAVKVDKNKTCTDEEFGVGDAVIEEIEAAMPKK